MDLCLHNIVEHMDITVHTPTAKTDGKNNSRIVDSIVTVSVSFLGKWWWNVKGESTTTASATAGMWPGEHGVPLTTRKLLHAVELNSVTSMTAVTMLTRRQRCLAYRVN